MNENQIIYQSKSNEAFNYCVKIKGNCMNFLMKDGDTTIASPINPNNLFIGDIVVFNLNEEFLIHRIYFRHKNNGKYTFITKGDMRSTFDRPIQEKQILGRVNIINNSYGSMNLITPLGRLLSWTIGIYSSLFYILNNLSKCILSGLFYLGSKLISLFRSLSYNFGRIIPGLNMKSDRILNKTAASMYHLTCFFQKISFIYNLLAFFPNFISSLYIYYFNNDTTE